MATYGFAIDLRKCIGCHACTIACKAEHQIPIGVNRCWVKTVEKGTFPDTTRLFFPVLCNQCEDAPCVSICPNARACKRRDGIVIFTATAASAAGPVWRHVRTTSSSSIRTRAPLKSAILCEQDRESAAACLRERLPDRMSCLRRPGRSRQRLSPASSAGGHHRQKAGEGNGPRVFYIGADESVLQPEASVRPLYYKEGQVQLRPLGAPTPDPDRPGDARVDYDVPHEKPWGTDMVVYPS